MRLFIAIVILLALLGLAWWRLWRAHQRLAEDVGSRYGPRRRRLLKFLFSQF